MRVLALDTALGACSAALLDGDKVRAHRYRALTRGHAEVLMGLIDEIEEEAGLRALDCDRLGVTVGPGTFTGLRVGLAAARGLALATGLPLVGVTTLQAIAANADTGSTPGRVLVLLDAKRGEVYGQLFEAAAELNPVTQPEVLSHEAAEAMVRSAITSHQVSLIGTGARLIAERIGEAALSVVYKGGTSEADFQPHAAAVARLASLVANPASAPPNPLYLRAPDAKIPSRNPLQ